MKIIFSNIHIIIKIISIMKLLSVHHEEKKVEKCLLSYMP
jgi:hypothetical protein